MPRKVASRSRSTSVPVATGRKESRRSSSNNEVLGVASEMAGRPRRDTVVSKPLSKTQPKKSSVQPQPVVALVDIANGVTDTNRSEDRVATRIAHETVSGRNRGRPPKNRTVPESHDVPEREPVQRPPSSASQGTLAAPRARGSKTVAPMIPRRTLQSSSLGPQPDPGKYGTSSADRLRLPATAVPPLREGLQGDASDGVQITHNDCGDGSGRAGASGVERYIGTRSGVGANRDTSGMVDQVGGGVVLREKHVEIGSRNSRISQPRLRSVRTNG